MSEKRRRFVGISVLFLFGSLLLHPQITQAAVIQSMQSFVTKLIPVLFPYMVLSHFFVDYRLLDPLTKCLGLGEDIGTVFLLGHLCGYPMGAKMTKEMQGRAHRESAAVLCALSSGASPAFLMHGVGSGLWQSIRYGIFLLTLQFGSSCMALWVWQRHSAFEKCIDHTEADENPFAGCFCRAVRDSTQQTLTIGGFIVFFTLLTAVLTATLTPVLPYAEKLTPFLSAFLEFSTGTRVAAGVGGYLGLFCTGFAVGFGGLSVLSQTAHLLEDTGISLRPYVGWKLFCGLFMGLSSMAWGLFEPTLLTVRAATDTLAGQESGVWLVGYLAILVMMWHIDVHRHGQRQ